MTQKVPSSRVGGMYDAKLGAGDERGKADKYKMYLLLPSWLWCKRNQWLVLCSGSTLSSSCNCCVLGLFTGKTSTRWGMSIEWHFCPAPGAQHSVPLLAVTERNAGILSSLSLSLVSGGIRAARLCSFLCPAGLQLMSAALLWSWNSNRCRWHCGSGVAMQVLILHWSISTGCQLWTVVMQRDLVLRTKCCHFHYGINSLFVRGEPSWNLKGLTIFGSPQRNYSSSWYSGSEWFKFTAH